MITYVELSQVLVTAGYLTDADIAGDWDAVDEDEAIIDEAEAELAADL
jgi:hypothetical protein